MFNGLKKIIAALSGFLWYRKTSHSHSKRKSDYHIDSSARQKNLNAAEKTAERNQPVSDDVRVLPEFEWTEDNAGSAEEVNDGQIEQSSPQKEAQQNEAEKQDDIQIVNQIRCSAFETPNENTKNQQEHDDQLSEEENTGSEITKEEKPEVVPEDQPFSIQETTQKEAEDQHASEISECASDDVNQDQNTETQQGKSDHLSAKTQVEKVKDNNQEESEHPVEKSNDNLKKVFVSPDEITVHYVMPEFDGTDVNDIMQVLINKVNQNKLIGCDLLQIAGNNEIKEKIHKNAILCLKDNYDRTHARNAYRGRIVISLILIALDYYDGNYWDHVRDVYADLYQNRSEQRLDAMIRNILAYYAKGEENRYINFVIRQAITPRYYLNDFISFTFDIYKDPFRYELPDNIETILKYVYLDVSKRYESTSGTIENAAKTYKLIKTTKDLIENVEWFSELIEYTKIILIYIDTYYWNKDKAKLPYQEYLKPVFDTWLSEHRELFFAEEYRHRSENAVWQPDFILTGTFVYLQIPDFMFSEENNPRDVRIRVSDGSEEKIFIPKRIVKKLGGYFMSAQSIMLTDPLSNIEYQITCGEKVLFDSGDKMHRSFMLFGQNNHELKETSSYSGEIQIVEKPSSHTDGVDVYFYNNFYALGNKYVQKHDVLKIDGEYIFFSDVSQNEIDGQLVNGVTIESEIHQYPVYRKVNYITLISSAKEENLILQVNESNYHVQHSEFAQYGDQHIYRLDMLGQIKDGFNYVKVIDRTTNGTLFSNKFFVDKNNLYQIYQTEDKKIHIKMQSVFTGQFDQEADMSKSHILQIPFSLPYFKHELHMIPKPTIPIYRIDMGEWHTFDDPISIKDIHEYSSIYVEGVDADRICFADLKGNIAEALAVKENQNQKIISCEKILRFESAKEDRGILLFYKNGLVRDGIHIYYHAVIKTKELLISYNDFDETLQIYAPYDGKDKVQVSLNDMDQHPVYSEYVDKNPIDIKIPDIKSMQKYQLIITGGEDDIFSASSGTYEMYKKTMRFYSYNDLIGRSFKVRKCRGEFYRKLQKDWIDRYYKMENTVIQFDHRIDQDNFTGHLKYQTDELPITVELTGDIDKGKFWCAIKYEEDFLLFDYNTNSVVFNETEQTKHNMPISEYQLQFDASLNEA